MNMRPGLIDWLEPPTPMNAMVASTAGSVRMMRGRLLVQLDIASNETSCAPSVTAKIWPMSSLGMKPFGMLENSQPVEHRDADEHEHAARAGTRA